MLASGFLLGTHEVHWVRTAGEPLFISRIRLQSKTDPAQLRANLPVAIADVGLDSGGFSLTQKYGVEAWDAVPPKAYVAGARRCVEEIGRVRWIAPQDWMCEPIVINGGVANGQRFAGTHLSVIEHQRRTVDNYLELRDLAPELPIIPVIQGFAVDDYKRCVEMYGAAGVDLSAEKLVGVGSVCRRQNTTEAGRILSAIHRMEVRRLHGFGFKILGLVQHGHLLDSADSMAWSFDARRAKPMVGHTTHKNCANCLPYALQWRQKVLAKVRAANLRANHGAAPALVRAA